MKVTKVLATQTDSNEKINFVFGQIAENRAIVLTKGSMLIKLLRYAFCDEKLPKDYNIDVEFSLGGQVYALRKYFENGQQKKALKVKDLDGNVIVVSENQEVVTYINKLLGVNVSEILKESYVACSAFEKFQERFDLTYFGKMGKYVSSYERALQGKPVIEITKPQRVVETPPVTEKELTKYKHDIELTQDKLDKAVSEYNNLTIVSSLVNSDDTEKEIKILKDKLKKLESKRDFIETKRKQIEDYHKVETLMPDASKIGKLHRECVALTAKIIDTKKQIEWREKEYENVSNQLVNKQKEYATALSNRVKIETIATEMSRTNELVENNRALTKSLEQLEGQINKLNNEKLTLKNNLSAVEESIAEIKTGMDELDIPKKTVGEMLESIKINVKLDELETQIEKLRSEITIRETQIGDKESSLAVVNKQVRAILDLDVIVAPYKAREAIMSVINVKIAKLENINSTLSVKQRNLERALETANFNLSSVRQACNIISAELEKTKEHKADEFKRQVLINSQKMYNDATAIYAVNSNFSDAEVMTIKAELTARESQKESYIASVSALNGELKSIKRSIEINESEIASLNKEKDNIIYRYNQMVNENTNDTVFSYLRALETDKGTKYLLDVSSNAVRAETEIKDIKKNIEQSKVKLSELNARYKNLLDSRNLIDSENGTLEYMVNSNEQTKTELSDVTVRLRAAYERHKAVLSHIDEIDMKILRVQELIVETQKTIKVNTHDIELAKQRADKIAGIDTDIIYQAESIENDLNNDISELMANKAEVEKQIFELKLDYEKDSWLCQAKNNEYNLSRDKLKTIFAEQNVTIEWIESVVDLSDENRLDTVNTINAYDKAKNDLNTQIEELSKHLVKVEDVIPQATDDKIDIITKEIETIKQELSVQTTAFEKLSTALEEYNLKISNRMVEEAKVEVVSTPVVVTVPKEITEFISRANGYLSKIIPEVTLGYDKVLELYRNGSFSTLSALEHQQQVMVFLALVLAIPKRGNEKGNFIIIDEKLECDKTRTTSSLVQIMDYIFVTGYAFKKQKGE